MMAIKRSVLMEIYSSLEWSKKLDEAKTSKDMIEVINEYCKQTNKKVVIVGRER